MTAISEQDQILFFKARASRYALYGVLIAGASVVLATLLVSYVMQGGISIDGIISGQHSNVALRMLDIMPFLFAAWGQYAGRNMAQAANRIVTDRLLGLRKALVQANSDSQAKSTFFSKMSHELRTPMNGILGTSELLSATELSDEQRRYVRLVQLSAQSLLNIINDLLDFSKIEAGHLKLEEIEFDIRECLEAPVLLLQQQARLKGLSLTSKVDPSLSKTLLGDPGRLRQIVINLIGNAVKFTHQGGVQMKAALIAETKDTLTVRLTVSDSGIGISAEARQRLFEPYIQAKSSTAREYGGTGLGLAISKELTEVMGGHIGVDSEEGRGSTFWIEVPFKKARRQAPEIRKLPLSGRRILIAHAPAAAEPWVAQYLTSLGMEVEQTTEGHYARARLAEAAEQGRPFDVALIDLFVSGTGGEALGTAIKGAPALSDIAMLMVTSAGQRGDALRAKEVGFAGYLTRPLTKHLLAAAIGRALSQKIDRSPQPEFITKYTLGAHSPRILVVEDSAINREIALHALAPHGYLLDFARNGAEGIEAAKKQRYDLLLIDLQMPVVDGLKATEEIRALPNRDEQGPIVILTAGTTDEVREQCFSAGAADVIIKPPSADMLVAVVERFLKPGAETQVVATPPTRLSSDPAFARVFVNEADGRIASLRTALAHADSETVAREAHTLKSTALHFAAADLSKAASRVESLARAGQLVQVQAIVPDLEMYYGELRAQLVD
ncbi:MAG: hybrid sensor histidine kinase/response regulator [Acidiferrobacteraceae bacterium]